MQSRVPTIIVKARAGDAEVADVRVSMDGSELTPRLDGRAIEVDVGEHAFGFERPGAPRVEQKLLISEGEKGRVVEVAFPLATTTPSSPERRNASLPTIVPSSPEASPGRSTPWTVYLLGGIGVAAMGTFATFGAMGLSGRGDLSGCKPGCSSHRIDGVATQFAVADASLAVGAVALLGAGVVYMLKGNPR
jgi:hypothetical protein